MTCHCLSLCPFLFHQNFTRPSIMVVIIRAGFGVTRCTFALDQYISDGDDNEDNDDDDDTMMTIIMMTMMMVMA